MLHNGAVGIPGHQQAVHTFPQVREYADGIRQMEVFGQFDDVEQRVVEHIEQLLTGGGRIVDSRRGHGDVAVIEQTGHSQL